MKIFVNLVLQHLSGIKRNDWSKIIYYRLQEIYLLLLTYRELVKSECEEIIKKIEEGVTAEEILEEYKLEDRSKELSENLEVLERLLPEEWQRYVIEERIREEGMGETVDRYWIWYNYWKKELGLGEGE